MWKLLRQRIASPLYAKNTSAEDVFRLAWECTCSNTIVTIVALYDKPQMLPLPEIYGKNLTFKTGVRAVVLRLLFY